jgi:hypothetical protein
VHEIVSNAPEAVHCTDRALQLSQLGFGKPRPEVAVWEVGSPDI